MEACQLPVLRSGFSRAALLSSYLNVFSVRSLRSTVITRFFATMDLSDSRLWTTFGYGFPPAAVRLPPHSTSGPPRFLGRSFPARCPQSPRVLRWPYVRLHFTGYRFHQIRLADQHYRVTRPNQVRLRCGSQVRISRLRLTDCSAVRSIATCRTDNSHGELLSSH
jgi:hypothetical protein